MNLNCFENKMYLLVQSSKLIKDLSNVINAVHTVESEKLNLNYINLIIKISNSIIRTLGFNI